MLCGAALLISSAWVEESMCVFCFSFFLIFPLFKKGTKMQSTEQLVLPLSLEFFFFFFMREGRGSALFSLTLS